jgi:hypothetical protein
MVFFNPAGGQIEDGAHARGALRAALKPWAVLMIAGAGRDLRRVFHTPLAASALPGPSLPSTAAQLGELLVALLVNRAHREHLPAVDRGADGG